MQNQNKFDLEERTAKFAENIIVLCQKIPKTVITIPIIGQLIRCATSIGANYCEANGASSRKDFRNKICICKKEAKETQFFLRILATAVKEDADECRVLWQEASELAKIFAKIAMNSK